MANPQGRYSNPFTATLTGIADLFRKQKDTVTLADTDRVDGKHVLITGASSGLGLEAAVQLARRGAHVWMACRSGIPEKGEYVRRMSGSGNVTMLPVDLSDMVSIQQLVDQLRKAGARLDILVDNAAVVPSKSRKTKQGLEEMFMVNYLSKVLLVRLLREHELFNTDGGRVPRIIYVSSESHRNPKAFDWEGFGTYKDYSMGKTVELYGYYKLLMTTFARELARRLNPSGAIRYSVFALCPGPVNSNIARESPALFKPLLRLVFRIFFRSPAAAVQPVMYFACSPEVQGKASDYLFLMSRREIDAKAIDADTGDRLWTLSEELLREQGVEFSV
jgi:NAD(P)-dependent dehydrogenase (short-subunit alcohol dehydrogenase family)